MQGLPKILSLFRDKLNKFNNTGAGLLGSIYCMTLKLLLKIALNYALMLPYNYMRNQIRPDKTSDMIWIKMFDTLVIFLKDYFLETLILLCVCVPK